MNDDPTLTVGKAGLDDVPLVINTCFDDIDRMGASLKGWGVTCTQLSRGPFHGQLTFLDQGDLQIYQLGLQQAVQVIGAKPSNSLIFAFSLQASLPSIYAHDASLAAGCIFGFDDRREVNMITHAQGFDVGNVTVSKTLLQAYAAQSGRYDLDESFMAQNVVVPESSRLTPLVSYLRELFWLSQQQPSLVSASLDAKLIEKDLLPLLINALKPREDREPLRTYPRADIVKIAREFMAMNLQRPLTLADICQAVHASKRSLHYGFQDMLGMGPMAFLKVLRLHEIRRILLSAEPKSLQVKEVANTWGFHSMGHFSRDYKQLFGESPSQTLGR